MTIAARRADAMRGMVTAMSGPEERAVSARPAFDAAYRRALEALLAV